MQPITDGNVNPKVSNRTSCTNKYNSVFLEHFRYLKSVLEIKNHTIADNNVPTANASFA